jgi:hypothetical protein
MEKPGGQLDSSMHSNSKLAPIKTPIAGLPVRNLFFLIVVLCHGFRRLLPPY